jgi:endonuclease YncB( thermonuclease family)
MAGRASIIDGNTFEIHDARIRLFGIEAPESDQLYRNAESDLSRCVQLNKGGPRSDDRLWGTFRTPRINLTMSVHQG